MSRVTVAVVGGGISGLVCASRLQVNVQALSFFLTW
jgi:phytoene dehydrogenase-like protein